MIVDTFKTVAGKQVLNYVNRKLAKERVSTIKDTQAGQAGAVPLPDSAPLVGGPRLNSDIPKEPELKYVNDRDAISFQQTTTGSMADVATNMMKDAHGTNGTPHKR